MKYVLVLMKTDGVTPVNGVPVALAVASAAETLTPLSTALTQTFGIASVKYMEGEVATAIPVPTVVRVEGDVVPNDQLTASGDVYHVAS